MNQEFDFNEVLKQFQPGKALVGQGRSHPIN